MVEDHIIISRGEYNSVERPGDATTLSMVEGHVSIPRCDYSSAECTRDVCRCCSVSLVIDSFPETSVFDLSLSDEASY